MQVHEKCMSPRFLRLEPIHLLTVLDIICAPVNADNSDVVIRSSDHVLFKLHRTNLSVVTGAFPCTEINVQGEYVQLTEPSNVLEIIFQYAYPQKHPSLENLPFDILLRVAEAVEKYDVFPAKWICEGRLRERTNGYPLEILVHGAKHDYPHLINASGLQLALKPLVSVVGKLPASLIVPWIKYSEEWRKIISDISELLGRQTTLGNKLAGCDHPAATDGTVYINPTYCIQCMVNLKAWVHDLGLIDSVEKLRHTISAPTPGESEEICFQCQQHAARVERRNNRNGDRSPRKTCMHFAYVQRRLLQSMDAIPPFANFLKKTQPEV